MSEFIFITGGARSGKSSYALKLAKQISTKNVAFIATAHPVDAEMKSRITRHKKERPEHWITYENPESIPTLIEGLDDQFDVVIIDCITLFLSSLMCTAFEESKIKTIISEITDQIALFNGTSIIVSNEVGLGIVPNNELGRKFRDLTGTVNQYIAQKCNTAFFMVASLPMKLK